MPPSRSTPFRQLLHQRLSKSGDVIVYLLTRDSLQRIRQNPVELIGTLDVQPGDWRPIFMNPSAHSLVDFSHQSRVQRLRLHFVVIALPQSQPDLLRPTEKELRFQFPFSRRIAEEGDNG